MKWIHLGTVLVVSFVSFTSASAVPLARLDVDRLTPGIQDFAAVDLGSSFEVAIVLENVEPTVPVQGFEARLDFDALVAMGLDASAASFLPAPFFELGRDIAAGSIELAGLSVSGSASGAGELVAFELQAVALGAMGLSGDLVLTSGLGTPVPFESRLVGRIDVVDPVGVIPEPSSAALFALGALVTSHAVRARRSLAR